MSELRRADPFFAVVSKGLKDGDPFTHLTKHWTWGLRKRLSERCVERGIWTRKQGREYLKYRRGHSLHMTYALHDEAYLFTHSESPLTGSAVEELKRFTDIFDFAYARFHELAVQRSAEPRADDPERP